MATYLDEELHSVFKSAALGEVPAADGTVTVVGPVSGPCDALILFRRHLIVAADVSEKWVRERVPARWEESGDDLGAALVQLMADLTDRLGRPHTSISNLVTAPHTASLLRGNLTPGGSADPTWAAYRTDLQSYRYQSLATEGTIVLGRGPGHRYDLYIEVDRADSGRAGRELLQAAKSLVPIDEGMYGSVPLHDPTMLRTSLAAGFQPIASEVLFLR